MAEIKSKGFEVRTDLSSADISQLEAQLPALGPSGSQALELIRQIAILANSVTEIGVELKLTFEQSAGVSLPPELLNTPISACTDRGFVINPLRKAGINTIGDLVVRTETDLMKLGSFGATALSLVRRILEEKGLSLKPG